MQFNIKSTKRFGLFVLSVMAILALSWSARKQPDCYQFIEIRDSLPGNQGAKERHDMDCDRALKKAREAAEHAAKSFEGIDWKVVQDRIQNSVDLQKIQAETRNSVQRALKNIDLNNVREEIDRNAKKLDDYFNSPEFQKQLDEIKKLDDQKIQRALERVNRDLEKGLEQLRREWSKEKKEAKEAA